MSNKKSVKQLIKEASLEKKPTTPKQGKFFTKAPIEGKKSGSLRSLITIKAASVKKKDSKGSTVVEDIKKLKDSLDELQASYGGLNELFNNTVAAKDNTVSSLLKDLRYTVDRLNKADFELRYDKASGSLFVDGEDAIAVDTPEVLGMLSSLVSLFPGKSISLKIDGDADYTDEAALEKLTELSEAPKVVEPDPVPERTSPEGNIETVLKGVGGDSKISDDDGALDPLDRFTCTYKGDAYSIWDKQLKTLVKVVSTPKEADALLEGLITGVTTSTEKASVEGEGADELPDPEFEENLDDVPAADVSGDAKKVMDSISTAPSWSDLAQYDAAKLQSLGYRGKGVNKYISKVVDDLSVPFFARVPGFEFFVDKNNCFTLDTAKAQKFLSDNEDSFTKFCVSGLGVSGLTKEDYFLTAYANRLRESFKI